jgi:hypothetical protein
MRLLGSLEGATPRDWQEGGVWLAYTLVGGLLPVYGGAIFLLLLFSDLSWARFLDHGEFAIYAAGLLAGALLVVGREYRGGFPGRSLWILLIAALLLIAAIVFTAAFAASAAPDLANNLNRGVLRVLSIVLYGLTVVLAFVLAVAKEALDKVNVEGIRAEDMQRLERGFNERLGGGV